MTTPTGIRFDADDFREQEISICGKLFVALAAGALYWPAEDALIVADLHLEKGSAYARHGQMLPPYDTRATLARLAAVLDQIDASTVVALGDSFHDRGGPERMSEQDADVLKVLQDGRDWIWLTGNHDPAVGERAGGVVRESITVEGITLRHEPTTARVTHEIAGHLHPAAKLSRHGHTIRRPCFVGNGLRLVLPAFGAFTGGLNVLDEAFEPLFGSDGISVWMLGQDGLYPVAPRNLRGD
ncbi:MAG: ligase-associated DNA damage response endonuclease PdeM [Hyphomicrobiaceae bacterium]|nr:ligase-associated DNA damage response endonuclease PdeM [Hyphomicrobiaceae bacterium]